MGWRDTLTKPATPSTEQPKKSWRDTISIPEPTAPKPSLEEISEWESFARGAAQGASFGFADEITGAGQALYEVATSDEIGLEDLADQYRKQRDDSRENYKRAAEANPWTSAAGELAGGVVTGIAVPFAAAGKAATVGGKIAAGVGLGAAEGAVQGAGRSEAPIDSKDFAKDVGISAGIGGAVGGAFNALGQVIPKGLKKVNSSVLDLDEEVTDALLVNPNAIKGAKSLHDIEDEVVDAASNLRKAITKKDTAIWNQLSSEPITPDLQFKLKLQTSQNINERLEKYGHVKLNAEGKKFINPLDTSKQIVKKAEAVKELVNQSNLSESDLKRIIKSIDNEINWDKQELEPINDFLQETRSGLDNVLKEMSPDYKKAMLSQAEDVKLLDDISKQYRLQKSGYRDGDGVKFISTDTTARKLKTAKDSIKNADQNNRLKDSLDKLSIYRKADESGAFFEQGADNYSFLNDLEKRRLADKASGGVTNGSRGVNLGAIGGGGAGVAIGGMVGGPVGLIAGAALGAARDKFGRSMGAGLAQLVGQMKNNYGRQFEAAARRGANAAGATHYLLYNKDEEYRKLYDAIQKAKDEEGIE